MFRPAPAPSRVGYVPLRLAVGVFILFLLLLAVVIGLPWPDVTTLVLALLTLAALGLVFVTPLLNYRAMTQTFERIKGLMRNILESIPTGVLTLDRSGAVSSLNGAA